MARYGTFAYSTTDSATETKYGVSFGTENSILYGLNIDWDGDGSYDQFNEASRVLAWSVDRGRDSIINPSGNGFTPYNIGRLIITLDNHDGRYDSWNTSSELYGNLMPGKKMQFRCRVCEYANEMDLQATTDSLYIYGTNADYDTARGTATGAIYTGNYVGQTYSNAFGVHSIRRSFLKFDTSYIGENINLSKVNLKITPTAVNNDADYNVLIKQHDWAENLEASADSAYDSCLASTDSYIFGNSANLIAGSVHSSSDLPTSWINKTTPTYYSLISSRDQAGDHYSVESADFDEYITFDQTNPVLHLEYQNISDYYVFTGIVTDIQLDGYRRTATMICEDGWRLLSDNKADGEYPLLVSGGGGTFSEFFGTLMFTLEYYDGYYDTAPYKRLYSDWDWKLQPYYSDTDYKQGPQIVMFDGTCKAELEDIAFGSLSRVWIDTENNFNFYGMHETTDSAVYNLTEDIILDNIYLPNQWENLRTRIVLNGNIFNSYGIANSTTDDVLVYSSTDPIKIPAGETVTVSVNPHYEGLSYIYIVDEYPNFDVDIYPNADGTGTSMWYDIHSAEGTKVYNDRRKLIKDFENPTTDDAYITSLDIYSEIAERMDEKWVYAASIAGTKVSDFNLYSKWFAVTKYAETPDHVYETSDTQADYERIDEVGDTLLSYLSQIRPYPIIQLRGRHEIQMLFDLEDKVNLNLPTYGIYEDFRIHKISHQTIGGLQDILTTLWLYPVITPV